MHFSDNPPPSVYDASAKTEGHPSLNDCLLTGPKFNQKILDILLRFRAHITAKSSLLYVVSLGTVKCDVHGIQTGLSQNGTVMFTALSHCPFDGLHDGTYSSNNTHNWGRAQWAGNNGKHVARKERSMLLAL